MTRRFKTTTERMELAWFSANELGTSPREDMTIYPVLAELDDLDWLPGELGAATDGNGLVAMVNRVELLLALSYASEELGFTNTTSGILDKVNHEDQHATSIHELRLRATHAIRFQSLTNGDIGMKTTTIAAGGPITKLGFASILAYPECPSSSDLHKLQVIGYEDVRDVARRIKETGANVPFPLSVSNDF